MNESERHLQLLTETTEAVNSSLDLDEVMTLIARKVAEALEADACFVYLYEESGDALTLRATFGAQLGEEERKPRMRIGEGLTGSSAAIRQPVMIAEGANLDPRFKAFKNLPEGEYESILASEKSQSVKLNFAKNTLTITATTPEVGEAKETLSINYKGKELTIAFNPQYMMDPLRNLDADEVFIELTDELSPGVIKVNAPFLYVLMPMRLS